jgi:predicted DNA-binding transcriptional regulator AlpA
MRRAAQRLGDAGGATRGVASPASRPDDHLGEPLNCSTEDQTPEPHSLAEALAELVRILPGLQRALENQARPRVEPLAYRLDQLAAAIGLSPRLIQKEVSAGRFPRPVKIGRVSVWPVDLLREYLAQRADGRGARG